MGSEIFDLKSFYLEDTVVRGVRISSKNARATRTIEVNPGEEPTVKTGETGINKEYLIQSSLSGNDLNGYGTFTDNSNVIRNYTGAQNLEHSDKIRLNGEKTFYTITGIEGTDVFIVEKYQKENTTDADVSSGVCDIRKIKLDSVKYESSDRNITYDKDSSEWGVTGAQMSDPVVAPSDTFEFDTGMDLKFKSGVLNNEPDLTSVQSEYKTLVDNNASPIYDVSLSPIPFPHESLQVYIGKHGEVPQKAVEYEDYAINYSSNPELRYPIPPFEERDVAYIKFLGYMVDEEQISEIDSDYEGRFTVVKEEEEGSVIVQKPLQEIIPTDDLSIKVGGTEKENNVDYIIDNEAGIVNTVSHNNSEYLINTIAVQRKLIWDGISVIRGVRENEVNNVNDLVIPPVEGLRGIDYPVYFEDTDSNNLLRDTDFIIDPESGAFTLTSPLKEDESVLISFYVEGDDIEDEKVDLNILRLKSFPIIVDSLVLNQKYTELNEEGNEITKNRIMIEGIDYTVSYVTGYLTIINLSQISKEIIASYTPMTQINCVAQSIPGEDINFRYTIVNDVLSFEQDNEGSKQLKFKVNNPIISIPQRIPFEKDKTEGNYNFSNTIIPDNILKLQTNTASKIFDVENASYDDITKIITLDESLNNITPSDGDIVVGTYSYESDVLPYAPILLLYTIINAGDNSFDIEGYDKTDVLKSGMVFRIDNSDPESTNYFLIKNVSYNNEKTTIEIYGTFPENVRDPDFYLFDDQVNWNDLSSDVTIETDTPIGSEQIIFTGNLLFIDNNISIGTLLLVNSQEIYSVTGVTFDESESTVGIYPSLRSSLTSNIKFSRLPVYNEGDTDLNANQFILDDPEQPAFTLWYEAPTGFDGSAKIIFIENIITIEETISGVINPEPYVFDTDNYDNIYDLAKDIQSTPSTYSLNVSDSDVPNYNPFTISHNDKEQYYLGEGTWSPESMIPFEEELFVSLPYTFTVAPELYKWSLLELYKGMNEFVVYNSNRISFFIPETVLSFYNRVSGRLFFTSVKRSYLSNEINTTVEITSLITENMINPILNIYYNIGWKDLYNELLSIDYDNNILIISGKLTQNLRSDTLLYVGFEYVFQIDSITEFSEYFTIKLNSNIPNEVSVQKYAGYIKYSPKPVPLNNPGDQPYIQFNYITPYNHTGKGYVKVFDDGISLHEVLDNYSNKETTFYYRDFNNFEELFEAVNQVESISSGYFPFNTILNNSYIDVLADNFNKYSLNTTESFVELSYSVIIAVSCISISYSVPSGYMGKAQIKMTTDAIYLKEIINNEEKETIISYASESTSIYDLVNRIIPGITSLVSSSSFPFSASINNQNYFGKGLWGDVLLSKNPTIYTDLSKDIYGRIVLLNWLYVGNLNEEKLQIDTDYTIDNGSIALISPIENKDRFRINYMGLNTLVDNAGDSITCTCRFLSYLPEGYRVDVYLDYLNIDQFYLQKLTERRFGEIVLTPQIEEFLDQIGSGGQGADSGATNDSVPNYEGGLVDLEYALQDENIKKQLYLRIYHWYKLRLRSLSAELQLGMGFKFAHSTHVGEVGDYYSIEDAYVEGNDYFLTTDDDIKQIENGFSKFFPIGYNGQSPAYYNQFGTNYLSFNEVYGCNIRYTDNNGNIVTRGIIKSNRPYWNKTSDLIFKVWSDDSVADNNNLVGHYYVNVPEKDRVFTPSEFSFLRVLEIGDRVKLDGFKNYYTISDIVSSEVKDYEYIVTDSIISDKGIEYFDLVILGKSFEEFMDVLPTDSMKIWINRQTKEDFPMSDNNGSLGPTAYGNKPKGHIINTRRIKKKFAVKLLNFLFPLPIDIEPTKIFGIYVKKDSEDTWDKIGDIDLSKLTFKEERDIDDVMDGLRYDFEEKFSLPAYTWYDITQDDNKGFHRYFYLSFEKIYDADEDKGYYEGIVIRAKNRNWWFKIQDSGDRPIVDDLGYIPGIEYRNFYDPENIYKKMLIEKQAWETEELIIRDLYDFNDKIARAFYQGNMNVVNSMYQDYLAKPDGGTIDGISDILKIRIPAYEAQLRFLIDPVGPVNRTLYPDLIHAEDSASSEIATTYNQTQQALSIYTTSYNKMLFYNILNSDNNEAWKDDYVRWTLSLEIGIIYQNIAKRMYEQSTRLLTVGLEEIPVMSIGFSNQNIYNITNAYISVASTYYGKYINILFFLVRNSTQEDIFPQSITFLLYSEEAIGGIKNIVDKTIDQVVSEISNYKYNNIRLFTADNIFNHYENNVTSKFINITNHQLSSSGLILNCSNVADHRSSDPRILYINRQIEDRVYTHEIRSVPGLNLEYIGNFYDLEYSQIAFRLYQTNDNDYYIDYQCFIDERNKKSIRIWLDRYGSPLVLTLYLLDENGEFLRYKTLNEFVVEINSIDSGSFNNLQAELIYSDGDLSCEFIKDNNYNVYGTQNSSVDVYFTLADVENDIAYYRITTENIENKNLEILFYELIKDGSTYRRTEDVEKIFTFNLNRSDGSYKTLEELCTEISEYNYRGDLIFKASSIYDIDPKDDLLTSYIVLNEEYLPIDQDLGSKIYVDTYIETLGNTKSDSRNISELKNAVFSFPMYTSNGNPNKIAIEDIPVSGNWEETEDKDVIDLECIDGDSWEVTFSDTSDQDYKSYMAPQEIIDLIDENQVLTQDQYDQIKIIEDRPAVPVIKELVLIRKSGDIRNEFHVNLRQYDTLFKLVDAISKATFNDDGEYDPNGNRKFFNAVLIGESDIEGQYKSYELDSYYNPIIKSFSVEDPKPGYPNNVSYKNNHVIGWEMAIEELDITEAYKLRMSSKRYSHGPTYQFTMNPPEQAYIDTLYNNPQGFRRDILAFDIYSWDTNAQYEIRDNWIYFKSATVDYSFASDLGQPNKNLGYGIPLAGSGHSSVEYNESLSDLINRINSNTIVNKWFYTNIKFTRDDEVNPGYFEYNYLPNFSSSVPKSNLDPIMLRNDNVISIRPGEGYSFTSSNITIDHSAETMDISCDWRYSYTYESTLFFNASGNTILGDLENSINNLLPPHFSLSLAEANVLPSFSSTTSSSLVPTLVDKPLTTSYTDLKVNTGSGQVSAFQVKLRSVSGPFFDIANAKFKVPISRDRITFSCTIIYYSSYSISSYDLSTQTIEEFCNVLNSVEDSPYTTLGPLFRLEVYSDVYNTLNAGRLLDIDSNIYIEGTNLTAYLENVIAIKLLNMYSAGNVNINNSNMLVTSFKTLNINLPTDRDIHSWIDENKGDFTEGFLSCDILPVKITAIDRGNLAIADYTLSVTNQPAHVYFGVMGDIRFVQISDYNLHTQYNYIKERLGKPWKDDQGDIVYDYYTPETYNENNPYAIDFDNFLGYLRTTRYNQIKNSIINEALVQNKYFWLYMKFHKEFGCDQRVITLKNQIEKRDQDINLLNGAL